MINVDSRVIVKDSKTFATTVETVKGTVKEIFDIGDIKLCLVKIDDGPTLKMRIDNLIPEPQEEKPDVITISRAELEKVITRVVDPDRYENKFSKLDNMLLLSMCGLVVCNELKKELFGETANNE
jgi:hypothetical protein